MHISLGLLFLANPLCLLALQRVGAELRPESTSRVGIEELYRYAAAVSERSCKFTVSNRIFVFVKHDSSKASADIF